MTWRKYFPMMVSLPALFFGGTLRDAPTPTFFLPPTPAPKPRQSRSAYWYQKRSHTYSPNGTRECARRRRQMAKQNAKGVVNGLEA